MRGPVHFFALDSDENEPDGVGSSSVQAAWLKRGLAGSTSNWNIVYFHHAPYSSGMHGSTTWMQWPFAAWGAQAVLTGHDHTYERLLVDGPVVQGGRIKVRSVGPDQRLDFRIDPNLVEQLQVAQGAVQFACKNRSKVDGLFRGVVKTNAEHVSRNDLERANSIDRMTHKTTYFNGSMGAGFRPCCSRCQSALNSA